MVTDEQIRETELARQLSGIDDRIAACRAWGHPWPSRKLMPGKALPRGFRPSLQRDGCVLYEETCERCGKERSWLTGSTSLFDRDARRSYVNPQGWRVIAQDQRVTPRDFQGEIFRRMDEQLKTAAYKNRVMEDSES